MKSPFECTQAMQVARMRNNHTEMFIDFYHRTLSGYSHQHEHESEKESDTQEVENCKAEMVVLKKKLEDEKSEREKLKQDKKRAVEDYETSQIERAQERGKLVRR